MSYNQVPPPYPEAPYANTQGPPQYPSGQPYMGQPYTYYQLSHQYCSQ